MATDTDEADTEEGTYGRGARIIAAILLVVALIAAIAGAVEGGTTGILEGVLLLYIAVVLAYGVFANCLDTPVMQTAFGAGLTGYGGLLYIESGNLLWLGLAVIGAVLTLYNGAEAVQSRR